MLCSFEIFLKIFWWQRLLQSWSFFYFFITFSHKKKHLYSTVVTLVKGWCLICGFLLSCINQYYSQDARFSMIVDRLSATLCKFKLYKTWLVISKVKKTGFQTFSLGYELYQLCWTVRNSHWTHSTLQIELWEWDGTETLWQFWRFYQRQNFPWSLKSPTQRKYHTWINILTGDNPY